MKQFGCENILEFLMVASDCNLALNKFLPFVLWFEKTHTVILYKTAISKNISKFRGQGNSLKQIWPALLRTQGGNFSFPENPYLSPLFVFVVQILDLEAFGGSLIRSWCYLYVGRPCLDESS